MLNDLRYAFRLLARKPGFAFVVVLTLTIGIGTNTAVFTVVDEVLLSPLPLNAPDELVRIQERHKNAVNVTGATFHDLEQRTRTLASVMAYRIMTRNLADMTQSVPPEQIDTAFVSKGFFDVAGTRPRLGSQFEPESYQKNAAKIVLLGDDLWRRMFSSDPKIVGQTVMFHGEAARVAGIMPPRFSFPQDVQLWAPLATDQAFEQNRRSHIMKVVGRVRSGVTVQQAQAELQTLGAAIDSDSHHVDPGLSFVATDLRESIVGDVRAALLILLSAVAFVLLIACANVVNLLLSRGVGQQKEIATRIALGASRVHILRQALCESLLLGFAGGTCGCVAGLWAVKVIAVSYPDAVPRLHSASLDWRIVAFIVVTSWLSAVIAGVLPAVQLSHVDPLRMLGGAGRSTETASRSKLRSALLVGEVGLALVLLTGAGLLIRSFMRVQDVNPGFNSTNVAVGNLTLPDARYPGFARRLQFIDAALEKISAVPGVTSVAAAGVLPLGAAPETDFEIAGKTTAPDNEPLAFVFTATADYFRTLSIPLLAGRSFNEHDTTTAPTVVVINQEFSRRYFGGENPVGRTITMKDWGDPLPAQIVGVVGDIRQSSMEAAPKPAVYFPFSQFSQGTLVTYLFAKSDGTSKFSMSSIRDSIWSVDKQIPVQVTSMNDVIADSLSRRRFLLTLLGSFAGLALLLATVGIYGVISYSVSQRTREFGIRFAVGARGRDVLIMVLSQSVRLAAAGVAGGVAASFLLTRGMKSLLYEVSANDPVTFGCIAALLFVVAMLAAVIPAYRAMRVDPMVALRYE